MEKIGNVQKTPLPLTGSDARGDNYRFRTDSLFLELNTSKAVPVFTLTLEDKVKVGPITYPEGDLEESDVPRVYMAIRPIYMEYAYDPTEYAFAENVIGCWTHWELLMNSAKLAPYIEDWRKEAAVKRKSIAIRQIIEHSKIEGPSGLAAARWIAEEKWIERASVGKPTAHSKRLKNEMNALLSKEIEEDIKRLKLFEEQADG